MAKIDADMVAQFFYKGAEIEISSNDEGFRGSWYQGKVLGQRKSKRNSCMKVLVKYKSLMKNEQNSRQLTEELDVMQLRPVPPPEKRRVFKFSEDVDAYYHDGWWAGVITDVLGENKYKVFFRHSREEGVFKASRLRLHREWVCGSGKWVPPLERESDVLTPSKKSKVEEVSLSDKRKLNKETVNNNFIPKAPVKVSNDDGFQNACFTRPAVKKSRRQEVNVSNRVKPEEERIFDFGPKALVEVRDREGGFEGAWFPAKIVKKLRDKYLVKYQTIRNVNDTKFLTEEIDGHDIRPCPPDIELVDRFEVHEEVEALYNDIWWVGEVSKVRKGDKYSVYFESANEELVFKHSDLRVHQEWINGKWIFPSEGQNL